MNSSVLRILFALVLVQVACASNSSCEVDRTASDFGRVFLSNSGESSKRGPLTMVLAPDSAYRLKTRSRRHVVCGRTSSKKRQAPPTFEQRAVCPFSQHSNRNENRLPVVLEEVRCHCDKPSHLSPYTQIRCQPLKYRIPVVLVDPETGKKLATHEELTLACIPMTPKEDDSSFEIHELGKR